MVKRSRIEKIRSILKQNLKIVGEEMKEIKIVPGYDWLMVDREGNFWNSRTKNKISTSLTTRGYLKVTTKIFGTKTVNCLAHRAIALAFIPNPENKPTVNHKNAIKTDNRVENLEWSTQKEQIAHSLEMELRNTPKGEDSNLSKHSEEDIHKVCSLIEGGYRNCDISKKLDIQQSLISSIRMGKCWQHITKDYNLKKIRRGRLSVETVKWICTNLQKGMHPKEILNMSTNANITIDMVRQIRLRNNYKDISKDFNF